MARIYPICSGSKANCTFIGTRGHGIIIDDGCSFLSLKNALSLIDTSPSDIEAVFITHEHSDHIDGLRVLLKNVRIPVFASGAVIDFLRNSGKIPEDAMLYNIFTEGYKSADFEITPFRTPHDTPESVGYVIDYGEHRIGVCTDTGTVTDEMLSYLTACNAALIESNYDPEMLRRNPNYSADLKRRITSDRGHLSNEDCAKLSETLVKSGVTRLILGHLSRENNTPNTALAATGNYLASKGLRRNIDYTIDIAPIVTEGQYIAL